MLGTPVALMLVGLFSSLLFVPSAAIETKMQELDGQPIQYPNTLQCGRSQHESTRFRTTNLPTL